MDLLTSIACSFRRCNKAVCRWLTNRGLVQRDGALNVRFGEYVKGLLAEHPELRILEVGGSSRPFLPKGFGTEYVGLDIDPVVSNTTVYDRWIIRSVEDSIPGTYDLVFSAYLLEHVRDNRKSVANMAECLKTGGHLICLFPCGYHPYSLATRLVGNRMQQWLIRILRPEAMGRTGYPVYFDHCNPRDFDRLLRQNGLLVEKQIIAWGASNYFDFFVPFFLAINLFNRVAQFCGIKQVSSGMLVHARKAAPVEADSVHGPATWSPGIVSEAGHGRQGTAPKSPAKLVS